MAIHVNNGKKVTDMFVNVGGEKKKITSVWVNKNNAPTKVFSGMTTWADATDAEIANLLEAHYNGQINLANLWQVGDERVVHLSAMASWNTTYGEAQPAQDVTLVILGFNIDTLQTPINGVTKAAVTVQLKKCLSNTGVIDADYAAYNESYHSCTLEWVACDRRRWCNNTFKGSLPSGLQGLIKTVKKTSYSVYFSGSPSRGEFSKGDDNFSKPSTCYDSCFLLSSSETGITSSKFNDPSYPYFIDNSRSKNTRWWVRNPGYSTIICTSLSWNDITSGRLGGQFIYNKGGIAPAFCL